MNQQLHSGSLIDPYYSEGDFQHASTSGTRDSEFKVQQLKALLDRSPHPVLRSDHLRVADVGCGNGSSSYLLAEILSGPQTSILVDGFDIYPHVADIKGTENVHFHFKDFCKLDPDQPYDLAVLFDVIEHVPDPIGFLRAVALRSKEIALHIPLDDFALGWIRNLPRSNLRHPGHLVALDVASSLNLLAFAGLRTRDYRFTPVFRAPTGRETSLQKLLLPIRAVLFSVSPYLVQRALGGVSLMVLATSPLGLR